MIGQKESNLASDWLRLVSGTMYIHCTDMVMSNIPEERRVEWLSQYNYAIYRPAGLNPYLQLSFERLS